MAVSKDIFNLSFRIDSLQTENDTLKKDREEPQTSVVKLWSRLEQTIYEVDEIESYSSRSCLIVHWSKPVRGKSDGKNTF